jgi:hypothetical protein
MDVFSGIRCSVGMNICGIDLDLNNYVSFDLLEQTWQDDQRSPHGLYVLDGT